MVRGECVLPEHLTCDKEDCRYWLPMQRHECSDCGLKVVCQDYAQVDDSRQLELDFFSESDEVIKNEIKTK